CASSGDRCVVWGRCVAADVAALPFDKKARSVPGSPWSLTILAADVCRILASRLSIPCLPPKSLYSMSAYQTSVRRGEGPPIQSIQPTERHDRLIPTDETF